MYTSITAPPSCLLSSLSLAFSVPCPSLLGISPLSLPLIFPLPRPPSHAHTPNVTRDKNNRNLTLVHLWLLLEQPLRQRLIRVRLDTQRRADAQHFEKKRQAAICGIGKGGRDFFADERRVGSDEGGQGAEGGGGGEGGVGAHP